ncbi:MAG: acetamidase/formamidase family protein, partial [Thermoplasmata archaeon]|nr:acetamidase/formamidase family protein [Thermoplasmata archaeon]
EIVVPDSSTGQLSATSRAVALRTLDWDRVDAAVGPISIRSAEPGDILRVEILAIEPGRWGWTGIFRNFGLLRGEFDDDLTTWRLRAGIAQGQSGFLRGTRIPLRPMIGVLGVLPGDGEHPMVPPERFGGNLDLPLLTVGAQVEFPVEVPGAGLSVGDPHGRQGWGEVCGTGIEMPARVRLRTTLRKRSPLASPRVRSPAEAAPEPAGITTTGIAADPARASVDATRAMVELLHDRGWTAAAAYALSSLVGSLRIGEAVDAPNWVVTLTVPQEYELPPGP